MVSTSCTRPSVPTDTTVQRVLSTGRTPSFINMVSVENVHHSGTMPLCVILCEGQGQAPDAANHKCCYYSLLGPQTVS